jgi:uncharacterized protein (DUF2141 family)
MIAIAKDRDLVTLINVFSCEPQDRQRLVDSWIRATEERLGALPGLVSAALHKSKDGTRVVNYANGGAPRVGKMSPASAVNPGSVKWQSMPSPTLIFTKSVTCWTKRARSARCESMRSFRNMFLLIGASLMLAGGVVPQTQAPQANTIQVEIAGLRNDKGQAVCSLFSSAGDFPKKTEKAVAHSTSVISNRRAACEFTGVFPGTYAISVFHDENSNGKLDTNSMGIPREGVGASNDAKGHFGPPKFAIASFRFAGGRLELKITINYL